MEMQMVLQVSLSRYRDRDDRISTFLGDGPLSVDARPARQTAGFFFVGTNTECFASMNLATPIVRETCGRLPDNKTISSGHSQ
jgi:hypothetical protein